MGTHRVMRQRTAPALILALLIAVAVVVAFGATAQQAAAQGTYTACETCHGMTATHGSAGHAGFFSTCATCHNDGSTAKPPLPSACGGCHGGVTAILAKSAHAAQSCGTTNGCHGYTSPTPTPTPTPTATTVKTTLTAKVAPTTVKVRKSVKVTGLAGPVAALKGAKVALKVERKVGTKWVKMKAGSATVSASGAYAWSYKTAKKGSHRVTASIAKTPTHTAKLVVKTFKVK